MKPTLAVTVLTLLLLTLAPAPGAEAARVRVVHRGHRTTVRVHTGFPLHRRLPHVYVRTPVEPIRVAPRVFLPPLVFSAVVVSTAPLPEVRVWRESEEIDEEWTELTLNVDRVGSSLLLEITEGPARISFAEVVFENGEAQVVDFDHHVHAPGRYALLDFEAGRKVDHVRLVAQAKNDQSEIAVDLLN